MQELSVIILTRNEEIHIERCLKNALLLTANIFLVDSYSTDKTIEIARKYTSNIFQNNFDSFSSKLNWAIENLPIKTSWTIRLDADELFSHKLLNELNSFVELQSSEVSGIYIKRQLWFLNKWMKHGGMYPIYQLRVWRSGSVSCENRFLDEHMLLNDGVSIKSNFDIIDKPMTSIKVWIEKHNQYSDLEILSINDVAENTNNMKVSINSTKQEEVKRFMKNNIYYKLPLFIRPFIYFVFRYFIKLGFLDGIEGLIWHLLHGFYFRFIIDVKIYEVKKKNLNK